MVMERQTALPEFVVPEWAKMLTGGVDVQETSFYYTIRAWGDYSTSQNITHGQVLSFQDIEEVMNLDYQKENGEKMQVNLCLVDSGYQPDATYDFCINNSDWSLPCKGASNAMYDRFKISKIDKKDSRAYGTALVIIDTDKIKDSIANRMRRENGVGSWMVFNGIDERYAQMVTSEQKVTERTKRGVQTHWVPKQSHIDNHYLDCEVYSMVAAEIRGVRTMHLENINNQGGPADKPISNEVSENGATIPGPSWISKDSLKDWENG
jgi:phage terminase large subunit GpA-like protein